LRSPRGRASRSAAPFILARLLPNRGCTWGGSTLCCAVLQLLLSGLAPRRPSPSRAAAGHAPLALLLLSGLITPCTAQQPTCFLTNLTCSPGAAVPAGFKLYPRQPFGTQSLPGNNSYPLDGFGIAARIPPQPWSRLPHPVEHFFDPLQTRLAVRRNCGATGRRAQRGVHPAQQGRPPTR
jgi:hypothetical protein